MELKLKKAELILVEKVREASIQIIAENGTDISSEVVREVAQKIEKTSKLKVKEFDNVNYYITQEKLKLYEAGIKSGVDKQEKAIYDISGDILNYAKEFRRERNKETSRIETNILSHAPFFAGGNHQLKRRAKAEGHVILDKSGLRKMTYENNLGAFLTCNDAKTLAGLFSLWSEQGSQEKVTFREYQLLERLNMDKGGKQYTLLRHSLAKLENTDVVFREAFELGKGQRTVTESFKLITAKTLTEDKDAKGRIINRELSLEFSPRIRKSFKEGYFTLISLALLDELESEAAKALYLMISAMQGMDRREEYLLEDGKLKIPLVTVYETLFLQNTNFKNKTAVEKACEELKHHDIITEYELDPPGRRAKYLIIMPSSWVRDAISSNLSNKLASDNKVMIEDNVTF
ncbi:replication initiator protein A [Priestia filamentosa]|uniref:replication initiator protein A n=1 Tax=Priestia filamentosa TaxID=1402861 RepID=UPI00058901F4